MEDNSSKVFNNLKDRIEHGLMEVGKAWLAKCTIQVTNMKVVDTGRLRASLSFITPTGKGGNIPVGNSKPEDQLFGNSKKNSITVGSNVPYAKINETGGSKRPARPFLTNSIMQSSELFQKIFEMALKGEI